MIGERDWFWVGQSAAELHIDTRCDCRDGGTLLYHSLTVAQWLR